MRHALSLAALSLALLACSRDASTDVAPGAAQSGAAAAAPPPSAQANGIAFTAKAPSVGDKLEEKESADLKIAVALTVAGQDKNIEVNEHETMTKRTEVLAVSGKAITKAKVTYVEKTKVKTQGDQEIKRPSKTAGKSYIVEAQGGKIVVTDMDGKAVSPVEEEEVRKNNTSIGKPDPVLAGLPDKPVQVGEEVPSLTRALEEFFKDRSDTGDHPDVSDVKVTFASSEGQGADKVGVFTLALTLETPPSKKAKGNMKAPLQGKLRVRMKDGWTTGIELAGPVTLTNDDPKMKFEGKGQMKMNVVMTY